MPCSDSSSLMLRIPRSHRSMPVVYELLAIFEYFHEYSLITFCHFVRGKVGERMLSARGAFNSTNILHRGDHFIYVLNDEPGLSMDDKFRNSTLIKCDDRAAACLCFDKGE